MDVGGTRTLLFTANTSSIVGTYSNLVTAATSYGELVADPVHHTAEFAVIIPDAWQGRGIGRALTDRCLGIAKDWGIKRISAETLPQNDRMVAIFKERKFKIELNEAQDTIIAMKKL